MYTYTRKNVWELGNDWADDILWYARGVKAMKERALAEPTSWRFYGAIHGLYQPLWKLYGYLPAGEPMPNPADIARFWNQCQHGSWYFLPWHRGYLLSFEAIIRDAVTKADGPSDWALPYWNYFKPNQAALPPAFASPDWPDGTGDNPLFVPQRYGPNNDGNVFVPLEEVNLDALTDPDFTGVASGGGPGFGGVDTGFAHSGQVHGGVETQPHDWVHGLVGGGNPANPRLPGLMSDPDTAGLDPIFWLHHANIDRLWQVWRDNPPAHIDPKESKWIKGPGSIGERIFSMPMPGAVTWDYTPGEMVDLAKLGYDYDDLSPAVAPDTPADRMTRLAPEAAAANAFAFAGGQNVPSEKNVELVGANQQPLRIQGETRTAVMVDPEARERVAMSFAPGAAPAVPDRVFLNLENVRGLADSTAFHVFISPRDTRVGLAAPREEKAGSVALFGVRKATEGDGPHAGQGLTFVLEITKIIDALHLSDALDVDAFDVRIAPVKPVPDDAEISIGRISIFRQGR